MTDSTPESAAPQRPGRVRRERSATESLLSIVLGLEAALLFFVAVTAFGLKVVPAAVALGGGLALMVVYVLAARYVRFSWGRWLGWVLQLGLVALGFLMPLMFFIGSGFLALWVYCFVTARRLDAQKRSTDLLDAGQNPDNRNNQGRPESQGRPKTPGHRNTPKETP